MSRTAEYAERLAGLPKPNKQLKEELMHMQAEVDSQDEEIAMQMIRVKALELEMVGLDKVLETRDNELQELAESGEKGSQKERKYFTQIEGYNRKLEAIKGEIAVLQQGIGTVGKASKAMASAVQGAVAEKAKVMAGMSKNQLRCNALSQQLAELRLRLAEGSIGGSREGTVEGGSGGTAQGESSAGSLRRDQKQVGELFQAIKKQMVLIDVIKKQKVHVIASTVFKYCEEDFEQLLDIGRK